MKIKTYIWLVSWLILLGGQMQAQTYHYKYKLHKRFFRGVTINRFENGQRGQGKFYQNINTEWEIERGFIRAWKKNWHFADKNDHENTEWHYVYSKLLRGMELTNYQLYYFPLRNKHEKCMKIALINLSASPITNFCVPFLIYDSSHSNTDSIANYFILCNYEDSVPPFLMKYLGCENYQGDANYKLLKYEIWGAYTTKSQKHKRKKMLTLYFCPKIGIVGYDAFNLRGIRFQKSRLISIDDKEIKEVLKENKCFTLFCDW